jgi:DNA-binding IclR family transcriptional regulator
MTDHSSSYRDRNSSSDKALDILLLFDESRPLLTGAEVAAMLGIGRSTAYRYLQSLAAGGFIETATGTGFRLGVRMLELAWLASKGLNMVDLARPVMRALADEAGESVMLARRSGPFVVCLAVEDSSQPLRTAYSPGDLLPVNAGAPALVLFAWAPPEEIERRIAAGVPRFTDTSVTEPEELRERLAVIRAHGFAISRGEFIPGMVGVAAPVQDASGHVIAAVSIAGMTRRIPDERVPGIVQQVRAAAAKIAQQVELLPSSDRMVLPAVGHA